MSKAISSYDDSGWRAQSDMRTLVDAQEIRNDPKRLKAALAEAKKQADGLASLSDDDSDTDDDTGKSGVKDGQL